MESKGVSGDTKDMTVQGGETIKTGLGREILEQWHLS